MRGFTVFQKVSEATNRQLRNSKTDLGLPLLRTSTGQKSFAYRGGAKCVECLRCCQSVLISRSALFKENVKPNCDLFIFSHFYQRLL